MCEIVGVVGDVRAGFDSPRPDEEIYLPLAQRPRLAARLVVRTDGLATIASAIRERIRSVDPEQAVADATSIDEIIAHRLGRPRSTMLIVTLFAAAALILATVGIYGVIAYTVARRRKEIGIRMALGASPGRVRALVFRQTARLLAVGLAIGLPISVLAGRYYASLLFDVQPGDPTTIGAAAAILIGVALAATYWPSARAAKVDPLVVLRSE
ncbi:MAG TPA: FtsX-like permease family protein [Bryobacteraceae bacterium]|nr:FtsX-like permease family protein [Bryobacteraceae bacterium]